VEIVACTPHGDGRYVIVASNGGSPTHPSWYYNLKANPRIEVELGTQTFTIVAEELEGTASTASSRSVRSRQAARPIWFLGLRERAVSPRDLAVVHRQKSSCRSSGADEGVAGG
jgi:deazaflavin-dependent oxidoreductase (nitroreductase family)